MEALIVVVAFMIVALTVAGVAGLGYVGGRAAQSWLDQPRARRATWRDI